MLNGKNNEEKIWNCLTAAGLSACGAAGLMGNLYAESGLSPTNLQNSFEKKLGYTDASYTAAVDNGSYTNFVRDSAGYGLAQWTYWSRKEALLDFTQAAGKSVGDLEIQLEFLLKELSGFGLLDELKSAASVRDASDLILLSFEMPAGMNSEATRAKRAGYGQVYYDKYAKENAAMKEQELRAKMVTIAQSYIGCKESDGSHKAIIDLYNSHKPLARGYKVTYTDAWCATFASAVAIVAGLTDIIPTECGCSAMIELFKKLGSWQENDAYVPGPGDYIFYDWQDTGVGDNTGAPDHVGIVEKVSGNTITVIEGNYSDAVKRRTIQVNGRYIRGYGVPKYASKAAAAGAASSTTNTTASSVKVDAAKYRLDALAGSYKTTSDLNLRTGAGTTKAVLTVVPKGGTVRNYGYYNELDGKKWLYVQYTAGGRTYTGYCSSAYLSKL